MSLDCYAECCKCCEQFACVMLYDEFCGTNCIPPAGEWCAHCGYQVCLTITCPPPPGDIACIPGFPTTDCDGNNVICPGGGVIECGPAPPCYGTFTCNGDGTATVNLSPGASAIATIGSHDVMTCYFTQGQPSGGGIACCDGGREGVGELWVNGAPSANGVVANGDVVQIFINWTQSGCSHERYVACEGVMAFMASVYKWVKGVFKLDAEAAKQYDTHNKKIMRQRKNITQHRRFKKRKPCGCKKKLL